MGWARLTNVRLKDTHKNIQRGNQWLKTNSEIEKTIVGGTGSPGHCIDGTWGTAIEKPGLKRAVK